MLVLYFLHEPYKFHHSRSLLPSVFKPTMDLHLLPFVGLLSLALVVTSATITLEDYWESMLPNTPMPESIRVLLPSEKGKGVKVGRKGVGLSNIDRSKGASGYRDAGLFLREEDLVSGTTTMNLHLTKPTTMAATFLPRQEAETIPFSSDKFSDVLQQFSVVPGSNEAQVMKKTIQECEEPAAHGEEKYCATSMESMVDFSKSKLGTNVQALSMEVDKEETQSQQYTITGRVEKMASDNALVCHGQPYVYAVFYCHAPPGLRVYKVPLVGANGTKANAIAVCHAYNTKLNPKNIASFPVLQVKSGATVCHFLSEDQVVWVQN